MSQHAKPKSISYQDYLKGTKQILDQSQQEFEPYLCIVDGREYVVHPDVFSPKYFHDTELFASNLPVRAGESFLEIGPGTGAISITAVYRGAVRVLAVDINPAAVANTLENIRRHSMDELVQVRLGDLYDALEPGETFDTIFWNTPFGLTEQIDITPLERAVFDPGYLATARFISEAPQYLTSQGRILVGFSSTLGKTELLEEYCRAANLTFECVFSQESVEVFPAKFEIFEARKGA